MEEHIPQLSYRNGFGERIEPANGFIYEINKYQIYKDRIELVETKFIRSTKEIKFYTRTINYPEYKLYIHVSLLGAPIEYLEKLPIFELEHKIKSKNETGKSNVLGRQVSRRRRKRA